MEKFFGNLFRRKSVPPDEEVLDTELNRCLTTADITLLAIGSMIGGGAGIYVITGHLAHSVTGPGVVLSYLIAGFICILTALCYAEFGYKIPKAGSAYTYTYVALGEIWAFFIGWSMLADKVIGAAAVAQAWSTFVDSMTGFKIRNSSIEEIPMPLIEDLTFLSPFPNFLAFAIVLLTGFFVALGARVSVWIANLGSCINILVMAFIIVYGLSFANIRHLNVMEFFSNGLGPVITGASRCFFAFVGFDAISTAAEETKTPQKSIPVSTMTSVSIVTIIYMLMSLSLTLAVPYASISEEEPFISMWSYLGVSWAKYPVMVGSLTAITSRICIHLFTLPRSVYSMADDGVIPQMFSIVHGYTQVPSYTIIFTTIIIGLIALTIDLNILINLLCLCRLLEFGIIAIGVLVLRYEEGKQFENHMIIDDSPCCQDEDCFEQRRLKTYGLLLLIILMSGALSQFPYGQLQNLEIGLLVVSIGFLGACLCLFQLIPRNEIMQDFKVPWVPFLPLVSIMCITTMLTGIPWQAWIALVVWTVPGMIIYFTYGYWNSNERIDCVGEDIIAIDTDDDCALN